MTYDEIVDALRHCADPSTCDPTCPRAGIGHGCIRGLKLEAATAIEQLLTAVAVLANRSDSPSPGPSG